jgi:hypothetical protein
MERAAWTDERLDDLVEATRSGFARIDEDLRGVRGEIGSLRGETRGEAGSIRGEVGSLRAEMNDGFAQLRGEMNAGFAEARSTMNRFGTGLLVALVGVIAAILARGV